MIKLNSLRSPFSLFEILACRLLFRVIFVAWYCIEQSQGIFMSWKFLQNWFSLWLLQLVWQLQQLDQNFLHTDVVDIFCVDKFAEEENRCHCSKTVCTASEETKWGFSRVHASGMILTLLSGFVRRNTIPLFFFPLSKCIFYASIERTLSCMSYTNISLCYVTFLASHVSLYDISDLKFLC